MEKLDLTKQYRRYYSAKPTPEIVEIETARYLSITGQGDPSSQAFSDKVQALYITAYTVKFAGKSAGKDFVVPKLEGLWWFDPDQYGTLTMDEAPQKVPRSAWEYQLLIRIPDFVTASEVATAIETVIAKKKTELAHELTLYEMTEGKSVQMLHVGPFDQEPETLRQIDEYMKVYHLAKNGRHHEIYLSDFRKTAPEKLRTILREPVK